MSTLPADPLTTSRNRILASLPTDEYAQLAPHIERVSLTIKRVLFDVDCPIEHIYFPETAVVSVLGVMADGTAVETATIGYEGMVGLPVFLGTDQTSAQAFVQIPGVGLRVPSAAFLDVLPHAPVLSRTLRSYTQALLTLVAQSSACNRRHVVLQRCARWLLHSHDRVERDDFQLTHQFLSQMLGVRRATVTEAMAAIQATGAITYDMGWIHVSDRKRLTAVVCECYAIIAREFDRLLGGTKGDTTRGAGPLESVALSEGGQTLLGDGASAEEDETAL